MNTRISRRDFLKGAGALAAIGALPISLVELAFADSAENFTFAYISDAHIQHIKGTEFVRNWDRGLIRAVAETNLLTPKPDFIMFGGDLAQLGSKPELDHGAEIMSALSGKVYYVMGEHDYYLDLGQYWEQLFGPQYHSFDHKGVHFVVLNSVLGLGVLWLLNSTAPVTGLTLGVNWFNALTVGVLGLPGLGLLLLVKWVLV